MINVWVQPEQFLKRKAETTQEIIKENPESTCNWKSEVVELKLMKKPSESITQIEGSEQPKPYIDLHDHHVVFIRYYPCVKDTTILCVSWIYYLLWWPPCCMHFEAGLGKTYNIRVCNGSPFIALCINQLLNSISQIIITQITDTIMSNGIHWKPKYTTLIKLLHFPICVKRVWEIKFSNWLMHRALHGLTLHTLMLYVLPKPAS